MTHDFDDNQVDYLTHMAHHFHGPTDFDKEVQKHLDRFAKEKSLATPEDTENQTESAEDQAVSNLSRHSAPIIPSAPNSKLPGF